VCGGVTRRGTVTNGVYVYEMVVFLAILSVAMLAGLLTTLLAVMRIIWNEQTDDTAATSFHEFLYARRQPAPSRLRWLARWPYCHSVTVRPPCCHVGAESVLPLTTERPDS
jgi:hypothetical protein